MHSAVRACALSLESLCIQPRALMHLASRACAFSLEACARSCAQSLWIQLSIDQLIEVGEVVAYIVRFAVRSDRTIGELKARS